MQVTLSSDKMLSSTAVAVRSPNAEVASSNSKMSFPLNKALAMAMR